MKACSCCGKHAVPVTYIHIGTCTYFCVCPVLIEYMHILLDTSWFHWTHAFLVGYRLFILIACVRYCKRKEWSCAHLVGAVMVWEGALQTIDPPFVVFRLHTICIIVDAIQIECNENMQLLSKTCSPCYIHAHWYMHIFLRLSSSYWIHAYPIGSKLISLDTCISCWIQAVHIDCMCGVLQAERMEFCALGGGGDGCRGGPAYIWSSIFFFSRLHTINTIVDALQIECNEIM